MRSATPRPCRRHALDWVHVAAGAVILVVSALPVDPMTVDDVEVGAFRAVNDAPDLPFALFWAPMQLGNILAVPAATLAALALRRVRLAMALALAGLLAWVVAKGVKAVVERGRPGSLLEETVLRDGHAGGLGFVSGHATVATAMATVAWPYLGGRGRVVVAVLVVLVCLLRLYVGSHLPLDVIGGVGLGLVAGGVARLLVGRPAATTETTLPAVGTA